MIVKVVEHLPKPSYFSDTAHAGRQRASSPGESGPAPQRRLVKRPKGEGKKKKKKKKKKRAKLKVSESVGKSARTLGE